MRSRDVVGMIALSVLISSCNDSTGAITGLPELRRASDGFGGEVAADGSVIHTARHDLSVKHGHLILDGVDHGRLSAKERARLDATFHDKDTALAVMRRLSTTGLSHVKRHPPRAAALRALQTAPQRARMPQHSKLPSTFFDQGRSALHAADAPAASASGFGSPIHRLEEVIDGGSWCDDHPDQCYWFMVDFQAAQDDYMARRAEQQNAFLEWLSGVGQDTFNEMFESMMGEMAGDEAAAYAEAMTSAFDFYTEVVDVYNTEQLIEMYDALNIDVWVGNTVGAFSGGWSIDCGDEFDAIEFSDICDDEEMM